MELHKMGLENFYVPMRLVHWVVTGKNRVLTELPLALIPKDAYKIPTYDLADLLEFISQLKSFMASKDVEMEVNIDLMAREIFWAMGEHTDITEFPEAIIGTSVLRDLRDGLGIVVVGLFKASQVVWVEEFLLEPKVTCLLANPELQMRFFNKITEIATKKKLTPVFKDPDIKKMYEGI